jgi:hypothetical protein
VDGLVEPPQLGVHDLGPLFERARLGGRRWRLGWLLLLRPSLGILRRLGRCLLALLVRRLPRQLGRHLLGPLLLLDGVDGSRQAVPLDVVEADRGDRVLGVEADRDEGLVGRRLLGQGGRVVEVGLLDVHVERSPDGAS